MLAHEHCLHLLSIHQLQFISVSTNKIISSESSSYNISVHTLCLDLRKKCLICFKRVLSSTNATKVHVYINNSATRTSVFMSTCNEAHIEYDLDIFNIVAVDDFNMGAMENKGLNIFNSKYVLASQETATDRDFELIEGIIAHEYFHN